MDELIRILKKGEVAVIPTDTIYGIVGAALNKESVNKIYTLRHRQPDKPMIILISRLEDLELFNLQLTSDIYHLLSNLWPNPVSVILPCDSFKLFYLHRGTNSLAFRMPKDKRLLELLKKTGPLVAPSANIEGKPAAETIDQAKKYFGDSISYYLDGGEVKGQSSTLLKLVGDKFEVLRQGAFKLP